MPLTTRQPNQRTEHQTCVQMIYNLHVEICALVRTVKGYIRVRVLEREKEREKE